MTLLKPCPFCGGTDLSPNGTMDDYFYQCHDCTTTGPNGADWESAEFQWNRRVYTLESAFIEVKSEVKKRECLKCGRLWKTTPEKRICSVCTHSEDKKETR